MIYTDRFRSPIGVISVCADESCVKRLVFGSVDRENRNTVTDEAVKQLKEYFAGTRKSFTVPVDPDGTEFQKTVWKSLMTVPYGETRTYKDMAKEIGNDKAFRAVGNANGANPIPIIIPCHRVVASSGKLGGYSAGLFRKIYLLRLERRYGAK